MKLTNAGEDEEFHKIQIDEKFAEKLKTELNMTSTYNPNFGVIHTFSDVQLVKEPLCWPYIQIMVRDLEKDEALIHSFSGCESSFTTISLIHFAGDLLEVHDLEYTKAQISRNQDHLSVVQYQIVPDVFLKQKGIIAPRIDFAKLGEGGQGLDPD